jgi:hypothetical protein
MGFFSGASNFVARNTRSFQGTPTVPAINIPEIPIPNIPTPGGALADLPGGISLLTSNLAGGVDDLIGPEGVVTNAMHRVAKAGKEAISGQGGYVDDAPGDPPGPGPTGFEAATAQSTLLTGQRKKGAGRSAHAQSGSASTV